MKYFNLIYNSFIWGLLTAIIAFQNVWLEMRMNMGIFIPVVMIIVIAIFIIIKKSQLFSFKFSAVNFIICAIISIFVLGFKRIKVIPASILREGLGVSRASFSSINIILIVLLVGGLTIIYAEYLLGGKK